MYNGANIPLTLMVKSIAISSQHKLYDRRIGAEFISIDKKTKEFIAKYVFQRQMEDIKKIRKDR